MGSWAGTLKSINVHFMLFHLIIDDREGSADLVNLPPLNQCLDCLSQKPPIITYTVQSIVSNSPVTLCPVNPSHSPIAILSRLESGDALIMGNGPDNKTVLVGVEIKSVTELLTSIDSGRLQDQMLRMTRDYDVIWLAYYGATSIHPETGSIQTPNPFNKKRILWSEYLLGNRTIPYAYLENLLFDLSDCGIYHKHIYYPDTIHSSRDARHKADLLEVARWLGSLYRRWSKPYHSHSGMKVLNTSAEVSTAEIKRKSTHVYRAALMPHLNDDANMSQRIRSASALPDIRYQRARAIAERFSTPRAIYNATEEELMAVPGIGKGIAQSILRAVTGKL